VVVIRRLLDSRLLWWALGIALVLQLSDMVRRGLARDPRFDARPARMHAEGPSWGGGELLEPVLARLESLGPVNLFDPRFESRIVGALTELPGVSSVDAIRRHWPRAYSVDVTFRRPVAVVVDEDRLVPVTASGIVLPPEPYRRAADGLMRIRGTGEPAPEAGATWDNERLRDGLATVLQLTGHLEELAPLRLYAVDVSGAADPSLGVTLLSRDRLEVRWGRPRKTVAENSVERKLTYLGIVAKEVASALGYAVDVRYDRLWWYALPDGRADP